MAASTSYNQNPSSSTSWDVFLSFRGKDTRNTFTGHLYKDLCRNGIKTFKDDPELLGGEVISRALPQAIQESKTYIVVLSENYASSSWCLEELVEILHCYKQMNRLVVPVFYYIHPSVVRHQLISFKEAFEKHQTRLGSEKVEEWRLTLKEVADFSGYHVSENRSEADIVDEVVSRILLEINPKTLHVATYPVGLDSRVKAVTTLFNSDTRGVVRIGIYGMGGVGKTTLAKAVYNQKHLDFPGSCFLANVREVSRTKGPVCLQQQLINDVLKRKDITIDTADQGIEVIRARICSTKVLVVIDDLDDPKHLKYLEGSFALGSIVIITTRYEDLLDKIEVKAKYKVNQMDEDESLRLFNQHAFGEDKKLHTFPELSKEVLERAGGLPLALQVFGSTLFNESEDGWKMFIKKLKRAPIDDVEKNLMISFDALKSVDPSLQDIFLDIACFYIGWKKEEVVKILESCYTFVNHKIDILQKRCLITISSEEDDEDDDGELEMHDLLQDMGRKIARNDYELGKCRRLWVWEDTYTVLKNHKGTEAIHGIIFDCKKEDEGVTFDVKSFKTMSKLKFLFLSNVNLTGSFEQTFVDLRWLCWECCPLECLPSKFYPQELVVLELPFNRLRTMWERNMVFLKMKTLNMPMSKNLTTTPDFNRFPLLETIDLAVCSSLEEVHVSIGILVNLVHLNLRNCKNLRSLPDSICSLRALEVLIITGCSRLEALPTELGSIESLKKLRADSCCNLLSISELPPNLELIDANNCCSLKRLPELSSLKHLKKLDLTNCKALKDIQGLEEVTSLEVLRFVNCSSLERLPNLCNLKEIIDLYLSGCCNLLSVSEFPPNLERVDAKGCWSLKRLPDLSSLKHLKYLELTDCEALKEIRGSEEVTSLEYLCLVNCRSLKRLPNLCNLKEIISLNLSGCHNLLSISELPPYLERIDAEDCCSLKKLPDLSSLKHLKYLELTNCEALKEIQGLEEVTSLEDLGLDNCRSLERIPNICNLKEIMYLNFSGCCNLLSISEFPSILVRIDADNCWSLKRLPDLSSLKHLMRLDLTNCQALKEIQGLEELTSLRVLKMAGCSSSLQTCTLTKRFFEILSGFGHPVKIYIGRKESGDWTSLPSEFRFDRYGLDLDLECGIQLEIGSNASQNFLAIILAFEDFFSSGAGCKYWVKNITSGGVRKNDLYSIPQSESLIVILPNSILPIRGGDKIELQSDEEVICGIHLLYKTENPMMNEYFSSTDNVEDERSYALYGEFESNKKSLSLDSSSTTVHVGEQRSNTRFSRSILIYVVVSIMVFLLSFLFN